MIDHFSGVAPAYAAHRPHYPPALFDWLAALVRRHDLVWDCAAGSGQATRGLASWFRRVVATDMSRAQLAAAPPRARVLAWAARAEASGIRRGRVDLVAVGQALHWFDLSAFYAEVRRVLAAGGAVAAWTYANPRLGEPASDTVLQHFYRDAVGPYWPAERRLVESRYATLPFPFREVTAPDFAMTAEWTLAEVVGYVGTWSAVSAYRAAQGRDPVPTLAAALEPTWGDPRRRRPVTWTLTVRAGYADAPPEER
ncbi:MAG TPA: methyltransferase domain-containing protein [Gemmatimonadales bacterium]|nr:methyltransferase domain-containing protein [Gemmatimonadales bacterium]